MAAADAMTAARFSWRIFLEESLKAVEFTTPFETPAPVKADWRVPRRL